MTGRIWVLEEYCLVQELDISNFSSLTSLEDFSAIDIQQILNLKWLLTFSDKEAQTENIANNTNAEILFPEDSYNENTLMPEHLRDLFKTYGYPEEFMASSLAISLHVAVPQQAVFIATRELLVSIKFLLGNSIFTFSL